MKIKNFLILLICCLNVFYSFSQKDTVNLNEFSIILEEENELIYFFQMNFDSPFLPNHGDIFYMGLPIEQEEIINNLNKICGVESYIFYDEKNDEKIIIFHIDENVDHQFYEKLLFNFLYWEYESVFEKIEYQEKKKRKNQEKLFENLLEKKS